MNKYVELVKKWLDDPDSVTEGDMKNNRNDAYDAYVAAKYAAKAAHYYAEPDRSAYFIGLYEGIVGGDDE